MTLLFNYSIPRFLQMVTKTQISNYLVVAIDSQLRDDLVKKGYNVYYKDISVSLFSAVPIDHHCQDIA